MGRGKYKRKPVEAQEDDLTKSPTLDIAAIAVPKASDVLAESLRERIFEEKLPEGTRLPSERELSEKSGLSRTSVRGALRVLEIEGLIATKTGRGGGSVVLKPRREQIARSFELFVRSHGVTIEAVLEARQAIEPSAARLAALHRGDADIAELEQLNREMEMLTGDALKFRKLNLAWHHAVVEASRNDLLTTFFSAISQLFHAATEYRELHTRQRRAEIVNAHKRVLDAIVARDGDAAFRRMARHIGAYKLVVEELSSQ